MIGCKFIKDTQKDIRQHVLDNLEDAFLDNVLVNFYLTSIYDYSIFEVLSRIVHKLVPQAGIMENLMNALTMVRLLLFISLEFRNRQGVSL